jgi:hypothetical protein
MYYTTQTMYKTRENKKTLFKELNANRRRSTPGCWPHQGSMIIRRGLRRDPVPLSIVEIFLDILHRRGPRTPFSLIASPPVDGRRAPPSLGGPAAPPSVPQIPGVTVSVRQVLFPVDAIATVIAFLTRVGTTARATRTVASAARTVGCGGTPFIAPDRGGWIFGPLGWDEQEQGGHKTRDRPGCPTANLQSIFRAFVTSSEQVRVDRGGGLHVVVSVLGVALAAEFDECIATRREIERCSKTVCKIRKSDKSGRNDETESVGEDTFSPRNSRTTTNPRDRGSVSTRSHSQGQVSLVRIGGTASPRPWRTRRLDRARGRSDGRIHLRVGACVRVAWRRYVASHERAKAVGQRL